MKRVLLAYVLVALMLSINVGVSAADGTVDAAGKPRLLDRVLKRLHLQRIARASEKKSTANAGSDAGESPARIKEQASVVAPDATPAADPAGGKVVPPSAQDAKTAQAVSTIPGVNVDPSQMSTPVVDDQPIKGFHPIKKLLQPVVNLEKSSVALGQQVMRLEGPIASLQTPMVGLRWARQWPLSSSTNTDASCSLTHGKKTFLS